jgi:hypothetical protein
MPSITKAQAVALRSVAEPGTRMKRTDRGRGRSLKFSAPDGATVYPVTAEAIIQRGYLIREPHAGDPYGVYPIAYYRITDAGRVALADYDAKR